MDRKRLLIANLFALVLLTVAFIPTSSQQGVRDYDPWYDMNDDGKIDIKDIASIAIKFGTAGTPINKTALLLELQSKVADLEARVNALEANYSVTSLKLAANAIPLGLISSTALISTTETVGYTNMTGMSLTLTLNRTRDLLIIFSAVAANDAGGQRIWIKAVKDPWTALPGPICFTPIVYDYSLLWYDNLDYMAYTFNFLYPSVGVGTHTIRMQWKVTGGTGFIGSRTLTVIALPA